MIKVGIYGSASIDDPIRKQLLRLLLRHPDVDLRSVASPAGNTMPLAELYPVYSGETDLRLERVLDLANLDVLFIIDESNITEEVIHKYQEDSNFRIIVLGDTKLLTSNKDGNYVYGLPELNRKPMVRGARAAYCPSGRAILMELALLPLAKHAIFTSQAKVSVSAPVNEEDFTDAREFLSLNFPIGNIVAGEPLPAAPFDRIDLHAELETEIAVEEIIRIYRETYEDHNFVHIIPGTGTIEEDLRGSNKCLIRLGNADGRLIIDASIDALTKGCTGNAVHIMNLFFGLHERTGLNI